MNLRADAKEIARALAVLFQAGDTIEMRVPKTEHEGTVSGYFNDHAALAKALASRNGDPGIYITLNPVNPDLLARCLNRVKSRARATTGNKDIAQRRLLLLDFDPQRAAEISSTDEEHEAALDRARHVRFVLSEEGWPAPVLCDSGNGGHLLYRIDLPNDAASTTLVEGVLKALSEQFSDDAVKVDLTMGNAGRITKAYGTVVRKGDDMPDRPHRLSRLLDVPNALTPVPRELLEEMAASAPRSATASKPVPARNTGGRTGQFDLEAFLARHLQAREPVPYQGGRKFVLEECPFNAEHQDSAILESAGGVLGFKCFHNSCAGFGWKDVREHFEGPRPNRRPHELAQATETSPGTRVEPMTLAQVHEVFRRWLHLPDAGFVTVALAAVAANRITGDPVWLLLIGPPASGKTETLDALLGLPDMHAAGVLSEAALLSGVSKRERAPDASGGLLRAIGDFGFIVCKDFTSVLSMSREVRTPLLAALREIYDGAWTRHVGTDGGRSLSWRGKCALLGASTPIIDECHSVMSAMGERFVLCRLPDIKSEEQARKALRHVGKEQIMRRELRRAVDGLFAGFTPSEFALDDEASVRLSALATLVAHCRSAVSRDGYRREVELIPGSERPARLVLSLARLLHGMRMLGAPEDECWRLVVAVGLDCIPDVRRRVFRFLQPRETTSTTTDIGLGIDYPTSTTRRALEDLAAHGVVTRYSKGPGRPDEWEISLFSCKLSRTAGIPRDTVPEKSEEVRTEGVPEKSEGV